jgi:hypothetical protein
MLPNWMDSSQKLNLSDQPPTNNAAFVYILYNVCELRLDYIVKNYNNILTYIHKTFFINYL